MSHFNSKPGARSWAELPRIYTLLPDNSKCKAQQCDQKWPFGFQGSVFFLSTMKTAMRPASRGHRWGPVRSREEFHAEKQRCGKEEMGVL